MLRRLLLLRPPLRRRRRLSSAPSPAVLKIPELPPTSLQSQPLPSPPRRRLPIYSLAAVAAISSVAAAAALAPDETLRRSHLLYTRMCHTAAAAAVLWRSLSSILSSANQEVRSGFELRVAALLADITAASPARRSAIVGAGGGMVVDWLLESVAGGGGDRGATQAESARALAHLVSDPGVCGEVLGRPHAVPSLLRFIFSFQPKKKKKHSSLDGQNLSKGKSMLVAALMDMIISNCDDRAHLSFHPSLPGNADTKDIAAALEVIEEGGMHFDDQQGDADDGDRGMRGIGIKILGGTTVLGFSRRSGLLKLEESDVDIEDSDAHLIKHVSLQESAERSEKIGNLTRVAAPGLWDDLQREHVAVPFAAWALANWALASNGNRSHIQELDGDGCAVMAALTAPERTVKWHGILVARALLDDKSLPLTDSVCDWSTSLLSTAFQASKAGDVSLARVALSTFVVSVERSNDAKMAVMEKGLHLMREIAKQSEKHRHLQEALAMVLELLYSGHMHLSLEESHKWSGILLNWIFGKFSSDTTRISSTKILSCILEDHGPASIPISQGWLTIMLSDILGASKTSIIKGNTPIKTDKVKTQIDQSNAVSAAQVANQLATAVVRLSVNQLGSEDDSVDKFPLADFLSAEPFSALFKNMNKNSLPKIDAADSAFATLKGIKALTEICSEDATCKNKIVDFGVLCLLRRFLLGDDFEKLAANETYDASRVLESREGGSAVSGDPYALNSKDPSSIRVPPTAHIRRHAARLLTILSILPKVKKTIAADETWCNWLENCANGRVSCCNDPKIQSYARATLLNIFCLDPTDEKTVNHEGSEVEGNKETKCPQYGDMLFLINTDWPHWKCPQRNDPGTSQGRSSVSPVDSLPSHGDECSESENDDTNSSVNDLTTESQSEAPLLDIVFIHGLRGGPFKSWRIADNKSSTTSKAGLVETIDQESGKHGTFWPREWLAADFPRARLFTVKYKTNLTQWSGSSLPLQEVSLMLLQKLAAAGIGDRPVVFVTHSMGGLVVKQMLYQAKANNLLKLVNNTVGVVFYSCPHFGSKLADMPWRMGLVFRPAPTIGELRSGSQRLVELNDFVRLLHSKGLLDVLSFSETQVTPIVEGYGGWAFRLEIVPIESAYPGFGNLVVLDATDHVNSCKPVNKTDLSYAETLEFLKKLEARVTGAT